MTNKTKKTPIRMCIACRAAKDKRELIRIVRDKDGAVSIDRTGKKNGRGAYICDDVNCLKKCVKQKSLSRAFSCEIEQSVYDALLGEFAVDEQN